MHCEHGCTRRARANPFSLSSSAGGPAESRTRVGLRHSPCTHCRPGRTTRHPPPHQSGSSVSAARTRRCVLGGSSPPRSGCRRRCTFKLKFSVKLSGLSVKIFISRCTYFATLNIKMTLRRTLGHHGRRRRSFPRAPATARPSAWRPFHRRGTAVSACCTGRISPSSPPTCAA